MADNDPSPLTLVADSLARLESAVAAGFAENRGEMRGLASRVGKLEQRDRERDAQSAAVQAHHERVWSRRDKAWAACGVTLTVAGIWFGPLVSEALEHH